MVGVVQRNLQRTEHAIHAITRTAPEHGFLLQDVLDFSATQRIVTCQGEVMDTTDFLTEFHPADDEVIIHELHLIGAEEWQLVGQVLLSGIAAHYIHFRERDILAENQASMDGRDDGKTRGHGYNPLE